MYKSISEMSNGEVIDEHAELKARVVRGPALNAAERERLEALTREFYNADRLPDC